MTTPLLIGGATTSRIHTAVKIEPAYSSPVVHVADASRAVAVAGALLDRDGRDAYAGRMRAEYEQVRREREGRRNREARLTLADARANRQVWTGPRPRPARRSSGVRAFEAYPLAELVERIDWTPFFTTWELRGAYPAIFADPKVGKAARDLHADAVALLARIVDERLLTASAVVGFWPANATPDDDLILFEDEARTRELARIHAIRQQMAKPDGGRTSSIADFVGPAGVADYIGAFAVTAGIGTTDLVADVRGGARRLLGDPRARPRRPARRGVRGAAPRAGPARAVGLRGRRGTLERRPHRRALPGHPARARLSGDPRPLGQVHAVRAARCRGPGGDRADGVPGDAARRLGLGALPVAPGEPLLRDRADRARPARGLRPARGDQRGRGRAPAWPEPSGRRPDLRLAR